MTATTARGAIPFPLGENDPLGPADPPNTDGHMRAIAERVAAVFALFDHTDPRPLAGVAGRFHRHPVTGLISYDFGTAWQELDFLPRTGKAADSELLDGLDSTAFLTRTDASAAFVAKANMAAMSAGLTGAVESTMSTAYTDLVTVGPDRDFIGPASGRAMVLFSSHSRSASSGDQAHTNVTVTRISDGAVIAAAADNPFSIAVPGAIGFLGASGFLTLSGLTPGTAYRARMKYRSAGGATANFVFRHIAVLPGA